MIADKTPNESERLQALRGYGILDTAPEPAYDDLARLAAHICRTPIAVVNFIDENRQWFKAEIGLGVRQTPLDTSICAHAILQQELFVIPDTLLDERFSGNPLCHSSPYLRFYAGALLQTPDGHPLGTLCVLDFVPRELDAEQQDALRALARQVMAQLELRRSYRNLRASEEFARSVIESSPDCVKVLDLQGRLLSIAAEGRRMMEIDDFSRWFEVRWIDFWEGPDRACALAAEEAARAGQQTRFVGTCSTMKGTPRWWDVIVSPIWGADGKPANLLVVSRDVTEWRLSEENLRTAAKLQSLEIMAGGVAHDFNNLLTGILGNASLLMDSATPPDRRLAQGIVDAAEEAAHLTLQILAYSGRSHVEPQSVDLARSLRDVLPLLQTSVKENVRYRIEVPMPLPPIHADPRQIRQLIMALLINAAEAYEGGPGVVVVTAVVTSVEKPDLKENGNAAPGTYIRLEVVDQGVGIADEVQSKIFDPFFTTKSIGRGLGLAAVSGIVRGHKGTLTLRSVPDQGAAFQVFLPVSQPAPRPKLTHYFGFQPPLT